MSEAQRARQIEPALRYLGDFVGWHLDADVERDRAHELAERYGLANALGFPAVHAGSAYRRAVIEAAKITESRRRVTENPFEIADEFLEQEHVVCRVTFDKDGRLTGTPAAELVTCSAPGHPAGQRFLAAYRQHGVLYTAGDVRTAFQRAFRAWGGVRMISRGGWWYIPSSAEPLVERWAGFLSDLGGWPIVVPQVASERTLATIRAVVRRDLEERLQQHLGRLTALSSGTVSTRPSTLARMAADLSSLRGDAHTHQCVLGCDFEAVKNQAAELIGALTRSEGVKNENFAKY